MTPALRWAAMRAILVFHNCEGQSHKTVSTDHNFWSERRAEADSNWCPSAYQPSTLPLGQTGSPITSHGIYLIYTQSDGLDPVSRSLACQKQTLEIVAVGPIVGPICMYTFLKYGHYVLYDSDSGTVSERLEKLKMFFVLHLNIYTCNFVSHLSVCSSCSRDWFNLKKIVFQWSHQEPKRRSTLI